MAVFCIAIFFSVAMYAAKAHAERITQIRVEGAQRIEPATILTYMNLQAGDEFDSDRLDTSLKNLFGTGLFADVSFFQEGSDLVVVVVENPIINEIAFEGNKKVKDADLQNEISLHPREVLTRTKIQQDVERLQEVYRIGGRFSADVQPKIIKRDQNRVDLVYEINEGPQTLISRMSFIGNKRYDDSKLQKVVRSKEDRWWRFWSGDDKYDPDRLAYDRELLRKFYLDHGYADFRVDSAIAELSPDRRNFFVTYTLDEGERYRVGKINLVSNVPSLETKGYKEYVTFKEEDWYKASELDKTISKLTTALEAHQFSFIDIRPSVERNREKHTIDVTFTFNEAAKVFVENINITGNVRTIDEVIRRELALSEGDPFNLAKLKKSEQNLKELAFFETATAKPVPGSSPDKTNIDVTVEEKSTGELSLGAGFSTTDGALGNFSVREKNFLGKGQDLSFSTTLAAKRTEFDISFTEPYFMKRDLSAGFDLFHTTRDYQDESSYDSKRSGGALRLGYPLADKWRQNLSYYFAANEITNVPTTASIYIQQQEGKRSTSAVTQRITYDGTDSKLDPTEGLIARFDTEVAGLGGSAQYGKVKLGGSYYYPVVDKWVLSLLGETGYIKAWGGDTVRINERFYLGGNNLRGFASAGVGPRDITTNDALGGNHFYRGSLELEFPSGLPEDLGVRVHVFSDFGSLGGLDVTGPGIVDQDSLRVSAGAGVSWKSPLGPVRADLATAIAKEDYDETEIFQFAFGTRF
ncbi:MAG TPA: outer membrane protein assembly factor BamA [Patescibacteria group bacterium]|nr:outer membrane protein assembly factor BamA [Patescibacteria group bacterium]